MAVIDLLKAAMRRGFTADLFPYKFHSDTPVKDKDCLFKGTADPNKQRYAELKSLSTGTTFKKYQDNKENDKYVAKTPMNPARLPNRRVIVATNAAETAVTFTAVGYVLTHAW